MARASTSTLRPPDTSVPAGSCAWASWSAGSSSAMETPRLRSRSGSGSMRTTRRAPPSTRTWAVAGTLAISRATSSDSLRSSPAGIASPCRVRVRKGTSSMVRSRTTGSMAPGGSSSGWARKSWCTFTRLGSSGSFTLKRTVSIAAEGMAVP